MSRILELKAENILRLSAVDIKPGAGATVVIAGRNGQGKTSVIDAIAMAIGGSALIPKHPITKGKLRGEVFVDLGDYTVTRLFARELVSAVEGDLLGAQPPAPRYTDTTSTLIVRGKDGARIKSPQALLDRMCGDLTFDPLEFMDLRPEVQAATLRRLAGIDTAGLDGKRQDAFEARTLVNREHKRLSALVSSAPVHPDTPAEEVSIDAIAAELDAAAKAAGAAALADRAVENTERDFKQAEQLLSRTDSELGLIAERLRALQNAREAGAAAVEEARRRALAAIDAATAAAAAVPDVEAIQARLRAADAVNRKVRENKAAADMRALVAAAEGEIATLTAGIAAIDEEKARLLQAAQFPVEGLALADDGVTFNGELLAQASTAEKMRVSIGMGLALNPELRVLLVRQGNDLDDDGVRLLEEHAARVGAQVWLERINGNPEGVAFVIEDGAVRGIE